MFVVRVIWPIKPRGDSATPAWSWLQRHDQTGRSNRDDEIADHASRVARRLRGSAYSKHAFAAWTSKRHRVPRHTIQTLRPSTDAAPPGFSASRGQSSLKTQHQPRRRTEHEVFWTCCRVGTRETVIRRCAVLGREDDLKREVGARRR